MPIALAAVYVYEGVAAYGAAVGVLATVSAGAMIAGGAITLVGAASGNKELQNDGMMIGAVGSLGTAASAIAAAPDAVGSAAPSAAEGGEQTATTAAGQTTADAAKAAASDASNVNLTSSPANTPAQTAPASQPSGLSAADNTKLDAIRTSQEAMQKYSMTSGILQGAGNAYSGWATAAAAKENQQRQLAFNQGLADRANSVGTVGIQPTGLLAVGNNSTNPPLTQTPTIPAPLKV